MTFRAALPADLPSLAALINRAYRGESSRLGWTTEADLLSGLRIDETGLKSLLDDPDSLLYLAEQGPQIVASIHAHRTREGVHFGLFAVEPSLQGNGTGKKLLDYAERQCLGVWGSDTAYMEVITLRNELIAFYERRGYSRTGEHIPFPESPLWGLNVPSLEMAVLRKSLSIA